VTHQHSLGLLWVAAIVPAAQLHRPQVQGRRLLLQLQSGELTSTERRLESTVSPVPHFRQIPDHSFGLRDLMFHMPHYSTFLVPDLNFRNYNWHWPSPASGLHSSFVKSGYSVHTTEDQTSKKW